MNRTFRYANLLVIGISATTISAAVVGDPLPVVGPAVAAGLFVAGHHVYHRERGDGADVKHVDDDRPENTRVYSDDDPSDGHGPDGPGRRPGRGDDRGGDDLRETFEQSARADGGRRR